MHGCSFVGNIRCGGKMTGSLSPEDRHGVKGKAESHTPPRQARNRTLSQLVCLQGRCSICLGLASPVPMACGFPSGPVQVRDKPGSRRQRRKSISPLSSRNLL
ncbi:hypothetical protein LZ32DRAFT_67274 [Colletotrichum eremochloae]|nr:hypothetical protein LZ32DRAFT_67274 [Colletotrichum eremochloae]